MASRLSITVGRWVSADDRHIHAGHETWVRNKSFPAQVFGSSI
jgi:hypothetical protein